MEKFTSLFSAKNLAVVLTATLTFSACKKTTPVDPIKPVTTVITGKTAETYTGEVATKWADMELKLIKTTANFTPPIAARALGYSNLSMYEAIVPGMADNQSLVNQLQGLATLPKPVAGEYNWALAANAARSSIIKSLYASTSEANKSTVDSLKMALENTFKGSSAAEVITRSNKFGEDIASAIFAYSKADGGHEAYKNVFPADYQLPVGASFWIPTGAQKIPMLPSWGNNRFFVAKNRNENPAAPKPFSFDASSSMFAEANVVYETSKNLTAEQKAIALFWADGGGTPTPPGHYLNLASIVLKKENSNLAKATEVYTKMGMALSDAFTSCWKCKYTYNLMRPVSYIQTAIDPTWKSFIATPPFPEYTSGHSSGSGAAAAVLTDAFGGSYAFTDNTGMPARNFTSFNQAAEEAKLSRLYGGIHFPMGNDEGQKNGKKIGTNVLGLKFKKTTTAIVQ
jgi:PAP2 superfamily